MDCSMLFHFTPKIMNCGKSKDKQDIIMKQTSFQFLFVKLYHFVINQKLVHF